MESTEDTTEEETKDAQQQEQEFYDVCKNYKK